ncbi:PREDICTED: uncharacterized protein LOC109482462 [Branchiostoma belcheri]|uniref:Uncharacterized protein LOC109482462 n=1 Tax=Branchiostoma belcheri TaxID=7741 RepID=A0A6P5A342_BRABE|nr:PREDICTED: uncharacterized protein LOC109482462 [Branchiostoma belcheri]
MRKPLPPAHRCTEPRSSSDTVATLRFPTYDFTMGFRTVFVLVLVCALVLETGAWSRRRSWYRRRRSYYTRRRSISVPVYASCRAPYTAPGTIMYNCYPPYVHGEACWWRCPSGYRYQSGSPYRQCRNGQWTGTIMFCIYDVVQALLGK